MKRMIVVGLMMLMAYAANGGVKVVTSLPDLADFVRHVGGDKVSVEYIVRGNQNPHFVEVKPSYMIKLRSADIFFTIGMDLEMWGPQLVDGSRNDHLTVVDLSTGIQKLEVPAGVDASMGDVHKFGNPHYWLDPRNVHVIVQEIVSAMAKVSPSDEQTFRANGDAYVKQLDQKIQGWEALMKPYAGSKVITFHKSWSYFAGWLGLVVADQVEPKPGIAPSPGHSAELIQLVKTSNIRAIIVEPFYDLGAPQQISRASGAAVLTLPTSSGGVDGVDDYISMMEYNVKTLANTLKH
jgi:ABC-type Zn uptake system ZnuABC Zn-binding protein ZnuA